MKKFFRIFLSVLIVMQGLLGVGVSVNAATLPQSGETYNYDFSDLKSYGNGNPIDQVMSSDGLVTINSNGAKIYYHGEEHGLAVRKGNSFDIKVAGNAKISFILCQYSKEGTIDVSGGAPGSHLFNESTPLKVPTDGEKVSFTYSGDATTLTFTVNSGDGESYVHGIEVENLPEGVDITPWVPKDFSLQIGQETLAIKGAASKSDATTANITSGSVYNTTSESAYISTDLKGKILSSSEVKNLSSDVVKNIKVESDGIVVTFADQATNPKEFRIKVQDRGSFKTPDKGEEFSFDLAGGDIPTEILLDTYTTDNGILAFGKGNDKSPKWHDSSHGLSVFNGNYFDVKVAGDADITFVICAYSKEGHLEVTNLAAGGEGSFDRNIFKAGTDGEEITYSYTGDATTLRFTLQGDTGENYLHAIKVSNKGQAEGSPVVEEQGSMPYEIDENESLNVIPDGHRLYVNHTDSNANIETLSNIGYYVFDGRTDATTIEADIEIQEVGNTSKNGVFFGLFEDADQISTIASVGLRGDKKIRNVYNKKETPTIATAGSMDIQYAVGDVIHLVSTKGQNGWNTEATVNGETNNATIAYSKLANISENQSVRHGFAFANVRAVVTNLRLKDENGKELYSQTKAYEAVGSAPTVTSVAEPTISPDRKTVTVNWSGDKAEGDGAYVVELSTDGGKTYSILDNYVMDNTYSVDVVKDGTYQFKIYGSIRDEKTPAMESAAIEVLVPLANPELSIESGDGVLTLNWKAVAKATSYEIYRKSSEQADYSLLAEVSETTYEDTDVVNETPYSYYLIAKSATNSSVASEPTLSVPSAGRVGKYAYEDEATAITITMKPNDTVYTNQVMLQGKVEKAGTMELVVNGEKREALPLVAGQMFGYAVNLDQGRNDVNLYFTDEEGKVTKKTFNFVYLTNYDMVVDSSYTGEEGAVSAEQPGVQQFSTVQAAVNAVPSDNQERVVILVKAGTYVEHLRVTSPFISLIGEDRDLVNIQFYDPVLSPEGGDTALRNAVYIMKSATGFSAENLTIENTYEYLGDGTKSNESADALRVDADLSTFVNVKLVGYQDTLYASSNRQYYYKSYIVGNVDFIYGAAQALIDDSDVVFRYNATKNSGYVTAPKTDADKKYGFIFNNSRITAEDGASGSKYLLARPWGPDGGATFINTYMSGIINKDTPYNDMSGNLAENARFYEYYTYGEGFSIHSGRPQISKSQAEEMLTTSFLGWDPYTTIKDLSTFYVGDILAETPEEETPAEETPVETPAEETPAEEVPVETPGEETPVEEVPVETPGEETPVEEVPVETPGEETPVEETPVETPGEETPVEETPVETPGEETPAEETPVETPAEETPAKQEQSVVVAVAEVTKGKATISDRDVAKVTTNGTFKVNLEDEEIEKVSVVLTKEQVEELMAKDATLSIENKGVMVELPISIFEEEGMSVLLEKLPAVNHAHSDVYDFTITQGDRVVSDFGEPVTLSFDVNLDGVEDPSKLKVFYLNEETGEWEKIGGSYENGVVTAQTYHFSRYTVFEESDIIVADQGEQSQEVVTSETPQPSDEKTETEGTTSEKTSDEASDKNRESAPTVATDSEATQSVKEADATGSRNDVNENNELPNTATNTGNILAMGILFAVAGIVLFFMRRKTRKEV